MDFLNYFTSLFYWSLKRKKKKKKTSRRSFRFPDPKKKFLHVVFLARGCISKSRFLFFFKPVSSTFSSLNVLHPASLSIFSPSTLTPTTAAQQGLGETLMYNVLMRNKRDATSSAHAHTHTHTLFYPICVFCIFLLSGSGKVFSVSLLSVWPSATLPSFPTPLHLSLHRILMCLIKHQA